MTDRTPPHSTDSTDHTDRDAARELDRNSNRGANDDRDRNHNCGREREREQTRPTERATDGGIGTDPETDTGAETEADASAPTRTETSNGQQAAEPVEHVPIADPSLSDTVLERVEAVLEDGMLADGPEVRAFEGEFSGFCRTQHAVATSNGTTALHAALESFGVEEGDAVVTSPFSFVASANAIRLAGATPVFADIDPETYTLDPADVERVLDDRDDIVGLLPVHLYGLPAQMPELCAIANEHDLFVLEDACQAHGATVDGKRVGGLGDAACFSFYPTKNMTTGEGGVVTTDRDDIADGVRRYVNHGRDPGEGGYDHTELGHNYRLTSLAAAIGRVQLQRLLEFNDARQANAAYYDEHLEAVPLETPTVPDGYGHVYHQYTVRTESPDERDALAESLAARNVDSSVYYDPPIHRQPAYESVSTAAASFPDAEHAAETVLSLPVHPSLSTQERRTVVEAVHDHYNL
ncbi:DegT/DnrJ/EryC1/StrS aminotransferase [Natrialba chahannaoensis JCM 10990]|uniref:DegT/DnrJ/EryC1/StrS aminotransferase n=1 Tax=Natrialba chahannaoensis JCM 10990 TaxID=1227492 RepID=M0A938_9EURY|nr:DegT/DnrJ/EryC1/StrS family aminotransferase [Natrialba chahannaoensis]ELY95295.1 DegT/DnrJ/EryC1/StrS aminotransferase [Natrialba chahannaoensis JCM 10990]